MSVAPLEGKALSATRIPEGCTVVAFDGAVRSSKTIASLLMWLRFVAHAPKTGALAMIGRTEGAIIRNAIEPLIDMLGTKRVVLNRGLGTVTIMGREVYLFGANDVQAVTKIQGMTLVGAYVDEAANVPEVFFNMLRSRLSAAGAMLYLTLNPEGPKHWLLTKWLRRARYYLDAKGQLHVKPEGAMVNVPDDDGNMSPQPVLNWWRVTFLLDDNTWLIRNNPDFVAELKASFPKGSVFYKRYIESKWVSAAGAVYGMWDEDRHTIALADLPRVERVYMAGLDYGTDHPTRGYLVGLTRIDDKPTLVVLGEFAPERATVGQHAAEFLNWLEGLSRIYGEPEWLAIDPAAAVFKAELFDRGRSDVMNAHNSVVSGIQVVAALLHSNRLVVVRERCPRLIEMLPQYMWDTKASEAGRTAPVKDDDDEADALRYAVFTSWAEWRGLIPLALVASRDTPQLEDAAR